MRVGRATPAIQGSKYTRSSCKPTKYQGAFEGLGVLLGSASGSSGAGISVDHTHKTTVVRRKHKTTVYMKYGHVSSYWSSPAVGTRRVCRAAWRTTPLLSLVAILEISLPFHPPDEASISRE